MRHVGWLAAALTLCLAATAWAEKSADEILKSMDDQANQFKDMKSKMTFTTQSAGGPEKITTVFTYQKGTKRLYDFSESGMAFLSLDADTSYVYLPEDKKIRRIAAHSHNQYFMGTDYNSDDMATTRYDQAYVPKLLETTDDEWTIELTPKPGKETAYSKIVLRVNRAMNVLNRLEYYNPKGELEKTESRRDYHQVTGQWFCQTIEIINVKTNHKTFAKMTETQINTGLADDLFTPRQLKRLEQ